MTALLAAGPAAAISAGLLFGILLCAAILGGFVARSLRVPRVVGYLIAGAAAKFLIGLIVDVHAPAFTASEAPLKAIKYLALGLILFAIGGVFESGHLRTVGRRLGRIALAESGTTFVLVFVGVFIASLAFGPAWPAATVFAFALLLGLASMETAPAATLFVLSEYEAKGPMSDTMLSVVGVNNVACIATFSIAFLALESFGLIPGAGPSGVGRAWLGLGAALPGSLILGLLFGVAMSVVHARLPAPDAVLVLLALLLVLGGGEGFMMAHTGVSYNFLLTALCMGAVFANIAVDPERLNTASKTVGQPLLVGFFAIAGFGLHLEDLGKLGVAGVVFVLCRLAGKTLGAWLGYKWTRNKRDLRPYFGAGMLCEATIAVGLADFVTQHWNDAGPAEGFKTTLLGAVVLFETTGPLLTRFVVVRAGEVKAATLLRRGGGGGGGSALAYAVESLLRTLGLARVGQRGESGALRVRHVMRTNIKCVPASATFDEVLRLVEQSRYNHFPVIDDHDRLVGVIHFSDIREIIYNPGLVDLVTAADLATTDDRCAPVQMPLEELVERLRTWEVGSLPVVDSEESRRVVGIVEQRDVLRALHKPLGAERA